MAKKQVSPKEKEVAPCTPTKNEGNETTVKSPKKKQVKNAAAVPKKLNAKTPAKKALKGPVKVTLKAKAKKPTVKINQRLAKAFLKNAKIDKKSLKNGIKERKKVVKKPKEKPLPVLEPIFPLNENVEIKKQPKKRPAKKSTKDDVKIKTEPMDDTLSVASDITDVSTSDTTPKSKRARVRKNVKQPAQEVAETETIEDVMNDLSFLIKSEEIKPEPDSMSESSRSDSARSKKIIRRQKLELLKETIIKKENIENTLAKLDSDGQKVIDMLDLNVQQVKKQPLRRHSIEKIPISPRETNNPNPVALFGTLPRCLSPKIAAKKTKPRTSIDGLIIKRCSPYTRSDSPTRLLRNGKRRKLRDINLFEGLEDKRVRRKGYVDLSGSESISKNSGYDSDSSFSDMSSVHGEQKDTSSKKEATIVVEEKPVETEKEEKMDDEIPKEILKEDTMTTTPEEIMDTNSNVCDKIKSIPDLLEINGKEPIVEEIEQNPPIIETTILPVVTITCKVPEKNIILDIMKQTFNENVDKSSNQPMLKTRTSEKFYGKTKKEDIITKVEPVSKDEPSTPTEEVIEKPEQQIEEKSAENIIETIEKSSEDISVQEKVDEETPPQVKPEETKKISEENIIEDMELLELNTEMPSLEKELTIEDSIPVIENMTELIEIIRDENMDSEPPQLEKNESIDCVSKESKDLKVIPLDEDDAIKNDERIIENIESNCNDNKSSDTKQDEVKENVDDTMECDKEVPMKKVESDVFAPKDKTTALEKVEKPSESPEELEKKESILKALGLQSLRAAEQAKSTQVNKSKEKPSTSKGESYTGTLKTVIKLNRDSKKKSSKNSLKMTLQKNRKSSNGDKQDERYKIMKESDMSWKQHGKDKDSSDTAGAQRKSHYSNRSNLDGSSEHTSDGECTQEIVKDLVIPEKASSFSIHPERLCKDECSYCFGKFGLFDTPCHIAQMKSVERQNKILATEKHLTRDSCLCDACYRHVDRKANTPSYSNKSLKRNSLVAPGPRQNCCHVLGCGNTATNILRRKWIIKMRKNICSVINIDLDNPGLHSIPICDEHFNALEHLMVCAMCKRRLARNHIHYLGSEVNDLNKALRSEGIPLTLTDKPVVCKLCKCFTSIILKKSVDRSTSGLHFMRDYKRRILHFNDIVPMDAAAAEEPLQFPAKNEKSSKEEKKKRKIDKQILALSDLKKDIVEPRVEHKSEPPVEKTEKEEEKVIPEEIINERVQQRVPSPEQPEITIQPEPEPVEQPVSITENKQVTPPTTIVTPNLEILPEIEPRKEPKKTTVPPATKIKDIVDISKNIPVSTNIIEIENNKNCEIAVQRLGCNPSISVRQLFPGEEDLPLTANIEFGNVKEKTPEGWEKCVSTIQFDEDTKRLWNELQKPYGNQSSFLRHLVLLEKYFRNGDLMLSPTASHHAINYRESVTNRLRAYDNIPTNLSNIQPISLMRFNSKYSSKSNSGIITSTNMVTSDNTNGGTTVQVNPVLANTPITLQQLNSPPLIPASNVLAQISKPKNPPGLMPLHSGSGRHSGSSRHQQPNSQKIKFPITKNWRPNLIPIDPSKKAERKPGLVQVISGGRPYHITLEDYKKMCAIKRSYEAKQKKLQDAQRSMYVSPQNSLLKSANKGLLISKSSSSATLSKSCESNGESAENILDKLDKQVEKLGQEAQRNERSMMLPKIPKSLTVIPQTVRKPRPPSPVVMISSKAGSA